MRAWRRFLLGMLLGVVTAWAMFSAGNLVSPALRRREQRLDQSAQQPIDDRPAAASAPPPFFEPMAILEPPPAEPDVNLPSGVEVPDPGERVAAGFTYDWPTRRPRRSIGAPVAAAIAIAISAVGFFVARPYVADLPTPTQVLAGSAIDVPYTTSGIGALRYLVTSSSGDIIASSALDQRSGTIHIPIPAAKQDTVYRVRVILVGPLGDASNAATFSVPAVPPARAIALVPPRKTVVAVAPTAPASKSSPDDGAPIAVATTSLGAGPVRVRIIHHYADLRVALVDGHAREFTGLTVPINARLVTLTHPAVVVATRVSVKAVYRVSHDWNTVVRIVTLLPASSR